MQDKEEQQKKYPLQKDGVLYGKPGAKRRRKELKPKC